MEKMNKNNVLEFSGTERDSSGTAKVSRWQGGTGRDTPLRGVPVSRLSDKLKSIHSIEELFGFANRRKVLGIADDKIAPLWTDEERELIVRRKFQLMKKGRK